MPNIINDIKLDFKDVLLRPKRSTLKSRADVSIWVSFTYISRQININILPSDSWSSYYWTLEILTRWQWLSCSATFLCFSFHFSILNISYTSNKYQLHFELPMEGEEYLRIAPKLSIALPKKKEKKKRVVEWHVAYRIYVYAFNCTILIPTILFFRGFGLMTRKIPLL